MNTKKDYIEQIQNDIDKYKDKISKIDILLENYNSNNKSELLDHRKNLKDKFEKAESMLEKIKSGGEEEYEKIKGEASEVFDGVKEAFHEFSSFLTIEQLYRAKDEIIDYGNEKLDEAQELLKQHPLTAAASALTLGFVIGSLFTRSK